ncbi:hypothetical protein ABFX02_09G064600 [Erythranthe guttata]
MATEALDSKNEEDFPGSEKKTEALDSCKKTKNEEDFPGSEKKRKLEGCDIRVFSSPDQREGGVRCDDEDESAIKKTRNEDSGTSILGCNNNDNQMMIIVHVSNNQTQRKSFGRLKRTARCRVLPTHKIRIIRGTSYDESDDEL